MAKPTGVGTRAGDDCGGRRGCDQGRLPRDSGHCLGVKVERLLGDGPLEIHDLDVDQGEGGDARGQGRTGAVGSLNLVLPLSHEAHQAFTDFLDLRRVCGPTPGEQSRTEMQRGGGFEREPG